MTTRPESKTIGAILVESYVRATSFFCSDVFACRLQALFLPALVRSRRRSDVSFFKRNGLLVARSQKQEIAFYAPERARRYIFPDGVRRAQKKMLKKYIPQRFYECSTLRTVVDIGANVGEFSMALIPSVNRVIAFEPDSSARRCLEVNIGNSPKAQVLSFALGSKRSTETFYISSKNADSSLIRPKSHEKSIKVLVERFDDVVESFVISDIDLIKVEAEGAEPEVLQGAKSVLQSTRFVTVDVSPEREGFSTEKEVEEILVESGFCIERPSRYVLFGSRGQ